MKQKIAHYWKQAGADWNYIFRNELRNIFKDQGILIFFFLVPFAYPLLYSFIYTNEVVREVPVAVVDESRSATSREYLRKVDATPDVRIAARCKDMDEAKATIRRRDTYGIIRVPADFSNRLARGEQAQVSIYTDMSGLLYYKSVLVANTEASLEMNARIKTALAGNTTAEQDRVTAYPIPYEAVSLYNPQDGFATFLIPAVLVLIIQQTLLLGVGIAAGTAREENRFRELMPVNRHYTGLLRIVLGKGAAYLLVYLPISVYVLGVVPHLFRLNQIGAPAQLALFAIPYLLACIFFAMSVSLVLRHRETCIIVIVFTSLPLLFISGVSWPGAAIPEFWKDLSYLFPSTPGINGFLKINNMGGTVQDIVPEWHLLWTQAIVYFFLTCWGYRRAIIVSRRHYIARYRQLKARHPAAAKRPMANSPLPDEATATDPQ